MRVSRKDHANAFCRLFSEIRKHLKNIASVRINQVTQSVASTRLPQRLRHVPHDRHYFPATIERTNGKSSSRKKFQNRGYWSSKTAAAYDTFSRKSKAYDEISSSVDHLVY